MIPLLDLKAQYKTIQAEIQAAINQVLDEQHFILGAKVQKFEDEIAQYCGIKHAIGVASGSDALLLVMMAIDVKPGDEIITTPYTFFATAGSISRLGAIPVFVDIDPKTYNINPALIEKKITKKTKAIIPVHLFGQCADMDPILAVAKKHHLVVIEDAAQALSSQYKGKMAGTIGDFGCFSFFPSKNLGGFGDGGMVITNDTNLADKIKILHVHGSKPKYFHEMIGLSSRLDTLQAAVLSVKLKYLDQWSKKRRENAARYTKLLAGMKIQTPYESPDGYHVYNQYIVRLKKRDEFKKFLADQGISTEIYYPLPLHLQKCYASLGYSAGAFPESEAAARETLGLPIYPELTAAQQEHLVSIVKKFLSE